MASAGLSGVVNGDDVLVLEAGDGAHFVRKAGADLRAGACEQDLDRHPTSQAGILSEPDFGHATAAEQLLEAVSLVNQVTRIHAVMQLPGFTIPITSLQRNTELLLLFGAAAFAIVGWRALEAAEFAMPPSSNRILAQFLLAGVLGHVGLRIVAPRAEGQPYAVAMVLAAVGMVFALRLVPELAQDQANWATVGVALMVLCAALARWYTRLMARCIRSAARRYVR